MKHNWNNYKKLAKTIKKCINIYIFLIIDEKFKRFFSNYNRNCFYNDF